MQLIDLKNGRESFPSSSSSVLIF